MASEQSLSESDSDSAPRIAIIGGGLAGLSAAHRLSELAKQRNRPLDITLYEAAEHLGGIVGTERVGEYLIDQGADSFLTNKPAGVGLCRRLGIENRLIPTDKRFRGALVLRAGRPVCVPEGFQLLSPTAIWPVITSPLFSVQGKIRLLMEWFIPRGKSAIHGDQSNSPNVLSAADDESVAAFVRRRFGSEALDRLIQPLVGGIYTSDLERLSLAATMPRFLQMEREYGSLIRASLHAKHRRNGDHGDTLQDGTPDAERSDSSSGARYGLFAGLKGGMEDLISALRNHVESTCHVCTKVKVLSVQKEPANGERSGGYRLKLLNGDEPTYSNVIVAATAARTAQILRPLDSRLADEIDGIEYSSCALVVSGHRLADISNRLEAFGLVIPHAERRRILAVSFSSRKFPDRAPPDRVLLRTFLGGALQPEIFHLNDGQMIDIVRSELLEILGVRGEPDFVQIYRYPQSMPQYFVGHLERVARIETLTNQLPGLALAGIAYRGVGIPDVIADGERAAEQILK